MDEGLFLFRFVSDTFLTISGELNFVTCYRLKVVCFVNTVFVQPLVIPFSFPHSMNFMINESEDINIEKCSRLKVKGIRRVRCGGCRRRG
jgi:hypothetical protein